MSGQTVKGSITRVLTELDVTRRGLLGKLEKKFDSKVIAYVANPNATPNFIDHNDPIFLNDVLEAVGKCEKLDFIIDSPGGDPNIAEKIATMARSYGNRFRVVVPNSAKSAATMIALASDEIVMGYLSEIGPIDPQIRVVDPRGQITFVPAQSILDSIGMLHQAIQQGVDHRVVIALIQRLDPAIVDVAQKAIQFSQQFAVNWLSKYMLVKDPKKAKDVADALADNRRWLSHGKRIGAQEAKELGLNVTDLPSEDESWKILWEYYSRATIHLNNTGTVKLFECLDLGLNFSVGQLGQLPRRRGQGPGDSID